MASLSDETTPPLLRQLRQLGMPEDQAVALFEHLANLGDAIFRTGPHDEQGVLRVCENWLRTGDPEDDSWRKP